MNPNSEKILTALGPLADLYADPDILEIMVDAPDRVLVERNGRLENAGVTLDSADSVRKLIENLLAINDETLKTGETIIPIHFYGGEARGVAVLPPTSIQGPCLVIRKLMNTNWISWEKLIEFGSITQEAYSCLQQAVNSRINILMAGGTGSGKTTVANRIGELIPENERLVIVEHTHELQIRHPRAVYLEADGHPGVTMGDLIYTGSLMRPDWLIIGELISSEAMRTVEIMAQGNSGMTTIHGNSLEDSLMRLEAMCLKGNMGLGLIEIRYLIASAIQLICYQKRLANGKRRIIDIAEVRGVKNGQYILDRIFRFNSDKELLEVTGIKPSWG